LAQEKNEGFLNNIKIDAKLPTLKLSAKLGKMLLEAKPEQREQAIKIAAKILAARANNKASKACLDK
jgi:hypothetical protein